MKLRTAGAGTGGGKLADQPVEAIGTAIGAKERLIVVVPDVAKKAAAGH
jgi:hypothetical protein